MKKLAVILFTFMITGCVTTGPLYKNFWKKDGSTYEQAVTTEAGCRYEVGMAKLESSAEKQQIIQACMMKEGYRWGSYIVN
ncbi:MAG: hypothetical protein GKR94_01980 [Gammaproteobacteria bacterium]|nr:hypothetical protein [Gammaproteobacteria bacterium]